MPAPVGPSRHINSSSTLTHSSSNSMTLKPHSPVRQLMVVVFPAPFRPQQAQRQHINPYTAAAAAAAYTSNPAHLSGSSWWWSCPPHGAPAGRTAAAQPIQSSSLNLKPRSPVRQLMVVVFPAPLGPSKQNSWPSGMPSQLPATAQKSRSGTALRPSGPWQRTHALSEAPAAANDTEGALKTLRRPYSSAA